VAIPRAGAAAGRLDRARRFPVLALAAALLAGFSPPALAQVKALLVGTDSGVPASLHSDSTWREIAAWVRVFGVPPMDALRAAAYWPAVAQKVDAEVGTLAPGKLADVIAVRGDVLRSVELLSRVELVIKRGARYR
jgi:imidazolonepropionase-like amidohydrolase